MAMAALLLILHGMAIAGDYTSIEIGHTGQRLRNSAPDQPKHYFGDSDALDRRLCILLDDVDRLLVKLHALPGQTSGTTPVACPLDKELGRLFDIALRYSPELDVPRSELAVLAAKTRQAGAKLDPMIGIELMDLPALNPVRPGDIEGVGMGLSVEQGFQSYGKRGLKREIASKDEALKELELAQMEVDLMLEIIEMYYDLFGAVARRRALEQNLELMRILVEMGERKLAVGTEPQAAVLSAQVAASRMELMIVELSAEIDQMFVQLAGMLGYPPGLDLREELQFDAAYPVPPDVFWDHDLITESLARWPAYQRQCLMREQQNLMVEMARREYFPDYMLMGRYRAAFGMEDSYSFEVRFPLFLNKQERQDAALQEAHAGKAVISDEAEAIAASYISRVEFLQVELDMHVKLANLLREGTVPQARLALESNIAGFGANMMDFSDLIMSQQSLLEQEIELEQNYIHILHTLSDLHVITLGAFDPLPYYTPTERPTVAAGSPLATSARATSVGVTAGWSITQAGNDVAKAYGPLLTVPTDDGFIEELGLPEAEITQEESQKSDENSRGGAPSPPAEEKEPVTPQSMSGGRKGDPPTDSVDGDEEPDANADFYKPFVPRRKKS